MITYNKLWKLMEAKGMKKTDLLEVVSSVTLAKISKNNNVNTETIEKICGFLKCQPGDIMEYISNEQMTELSKQLDKAGKTIIDAMKAEGISLEAFQSMIMNEMPKLIEEMAKGENPVTKEIEELIESTKEVK